MCLGSPGCIPRWDTQWKCCCPPAAGWVAGGTKLWGHGVAGEQGNHDFPALFISEVGD